MSKLTNFKRFLKKHWKPLVATLVILVVAGSAWALQLKPESNGNRIDRNTSSQEEAPITEAAPLTGIEVTPDIARQPVTAVIIENSPNARPQSALNAADIVFEAVTEGGITRFLAFFQQQNPGKIGPVRSLRPPFLDWIMGFDAPFAHVGGSAQALQLAAQRGAKSLNQFSNGDAYYRSNDRVAPHNMYTSISSLRALQKSRGYKPSSFKKIPRSDDAPAAEPVATRITVDFSSSLYQAQFHYQAENNSYSRYLAGSPHIDRETGEAIETKNVIIIKMPSRQNGQYVEMDTIGSGDAVLFKDGTSRNIRWRQSSYNDRIELLDGEGAEIKLNRGKSWFSILPSGRTLTVE
ncbi:MAG: DUF3048 domain-containing protein [Candidatus Saccharimonadales bacterium]